MKPFEAKTPNEQFLVLAMRAIALATAEGNFDWQTQQFLTKRERADFEGTFTNNGASFPCTVTCFISMKQQTGLLVLSAVSRKQEQFNVSFDEAGKVSLTPRQPAAPLPVFVTQEPYCQNRRSAAELL